jgi:putative ABC transport system permease protein
MYQMLKNYFRFAWRNLMNHRQFTVLNLMGLATGLACSLLIYLWVTDEWRVDKFHEKNDRLFQVMERQQQNGRVVVSHMTSGPVAGTLLQNMPEIENAVPVIHYSWFPKFTLVGSDDKKIKAVGQFAGEGFFTIFSYGLLRGDKLHLLSDPKSMVVSEALAMKLFNTTENIIGKTLEWQIGPVKRQAMISGVFKGTPVNSSEQFDFVLSFAGYEAFSPAVKEWGNDGTNTYIVVKKGTNPDQLEHKMAGLIDTRIPNSGRSLFLRPFSDAYLHGKYENGVQAGGRIEYVRLFSIVAIFILVIACINFMNLSTAKAAGRARETGIKKVMGARRYSLILEYFGESLLASFLSLIIALGLVWFLLPSFNSLTGKTLTLQLNANLLGSVLVITAITGLVSGSYPAIYLSGFKPVSVLKGKFRAAAGDLWVRKGLVVFQFTLSVIFIVGVLVVYRQTNLIQTKNIGYNRDHILYFEKEGTLEKNSEPFTAAMEKLPGVTGVSGADRLFNGSVNITDGINWPGKDPRRSPIF